MADDIQRTLEQFGLLWDGEIAWQSRNSEAYYQALELLKKRQLLYRCYCSRKEIMQMASAPHGDDDSLHYPGICRIAPAADKPLRSWRVHTIDQDICFHDLCSGIFCQNLQKSCGDFVLQRGDGTVAYQLAVVIDDQLSGITQVVRGSDLRYSTPRQIYLQRLLGIPQPSYAHLPLVINRDGTKLSKRDNLVSCQLGSWHNREQLLMVEILRFLGIETPRELRAAGCGELLRWGVGHFDLSRIPAINRCLEYGKS